MYITNETNVDYLIPELRFYIGDDVNQRYSDALLRTSIVNGIKMLQRRWDSRYLVYNDDLIADESTTSGYVYVRLPGKYSEPDQFGYIPSGYINNDIFRNPGHMFNSGSAYVISHEDEFIIILSSAIMLRRSHISSSADTYQSWSDGEFSFSNLGASRSLAMLYAEDLALLNEYLKKRLASVSVSTFDNNHSIKRY